MPDLSINNFKPTASWWRLERTREWICIVLIIIGTCVSWWPRRSGPIDLRWDAGAYYLLGTSLAEGKGYRLLSEPGDIEAIQYPPLLPAIVAVHQKVLGTSDPAVVGRWLRFAYFLFSIVSSVTSFAMARFFLPRRYALPLALICVWTYQMVFLSTLCFAELPFSLATVLCAYWSFKPSAGRGAQIGVGVTAIAAYLLRTVGIALLVAWVAEALFQKSFRTATLRAFVAVLPVLAWQGYVRSVEHSAAYQHPAYSYQRAPWMFYNVSYATNLALRSPFEPDKGAASQTDIVARVAGNLKTLPYNLGELLLAPSRMVYSYHAILNRFVAPFTIPWWPINGLMCFLGWCVIAGIGSWFWQKAWLPGVYLALTLAAICLTPWPGQVLRYLAPAVPFILLALLGLCYSVEKWASQRDLPGKSILPKFAGSVLVSIMLIACLATGKSAFANFLNEATFTDSDGTIRLYRLFFFPPVFSFMQKSMDWLKNTASPDSVVAVSMPHWVYLNTGLKTVMPPLDTNIVRAQQMLDSVPTRYLIIEHMLMEQDFNEQFPRLIRGSPENWQLVHTDGNVDIYRRTALSGPFAGAPAGL